MGKMRLRKGIKIYMDILRMCKKMHKYSQWLSQCGFFLCNVALCHWNTNKQKIMAGQIKLTMPWVFREVTPPFPHEHPSPATGALLAVQLMCPCVPSTRHPHHQGWELHGVLGHGHCPLVYWLGGDGVLHSGVLPTAFARRRGSQVSAAVTSTAWLD